MEQNVENVAPVAPALNNKQKSGKGLKITTAVACVVAACGIGFGVYGMVQGAQKDDRISDLQGQSSEDVKSEADLSTPATTPNCPKTADLINNGERIGKYAIYMGKNNLGEFTLTLFSPEDQKQDEGFFSLVQATAMSYNQEADGYYKINGSNIEFYQNMLNDADKNGFVNAFSMKLSDLYQDSQALRDGYKYQYRLKLDYKDGKISNNNITFEKVH